MGTQTLTSTTVLYHYFNAVLLLHVVVCQCQPGSPLGPQYPYESIFAPLWKALSDHGETRWGAGLKPSVKPDRMYVKYMTQVYKRSPRVHRSVDSSDLYNTLRLMKPLDKCLYQRNEMSMQELSYNLDRVGDTERLLKSVLLYSFDDDDLAASGSNSVCCLNIKEREYANQCSFCPGTHYQVNFTVHHPKNWVEVDITSLLLPLFKVHKRTVNLLINLTCSEGAGGGPAAAASLLRPRSPPLLLYLNNTSKSMRSPGGSSMAGQRSPMEEPPTLAAERRAFKSQQQVLRRKRKRRASLKTKKASLDLDLPELRPSSEFPTSDCALYDFKVRFSQLKYDHWIVYPPKYNPRYCRGICPSPMGFIYGSPVHTIVQNFIYEKLDTTVPQPACIPSHYSPLSVLIFEKDGSYVYKELDDMVATRCTCR